MAINVSAQYNGGLLPDIILVDPMLLPSGNPFECHEVFSPDRGMPRRSTCLNIFLKKVKARLWS